MTIKIPNAIDKHVGSRLRMRRLMLDMSQEELGQAFGLTFQQVTKRAPIEWVPVGCSTPLTLTCSPTCPRLLGESVPVLR